MNKRVEERLVLKASIKHFFQKVLLSIILLLVGMILLKEKPDLKTPIQEILFEQSFPFQRVKTFYETYFGNILSFDRMEKEEAVFHETLAYNKVESYEEGVKLEVSDHYLVPILESGVVVFIGEKENLGKTIIIEQIDGIDTYYSNIETINIKLYDYVEKGELLGETLGNHLYLSFQKNGEYLDYKKYL